MTANNRDAEKRAGEQYAVAEDAVSPGFVTISLEQYDAHRRALELLREAERKWLALDYAGSEIPLDKHEEVQITALYEWFEDWRDVVVEEVLPHFQQEPGDDFALERELRREHRMADSYFARESRGESGSGGPKRTFEQFLEDVADDHNHRLHKEALELRASRDETVALKP